MGICSSDIENDEDKQLKQLKQLKDTKNTSFINACKRGNIHVVKYLVKYDHINIYAEVEAIKYAIHGGKLNFLKYIVDNHNVNIKKWIDYIINNERKTVCMKCKAWSNYYDYDRDRNKFTCKERRSTSGSDKYYCKPSNFCEWDKFYDGRCEKNLETVAKLIKYIIKKNDNEINNYIEKKALEYGFCAVIGLLGKYKSKMHKNIGMHFDKEIENIVHEYVV